MNINLEISAPDIRLTKEIEIKLYHLIRDDDVKGVDSLIKTEILPVHPTFNLLDYTFIHDEFNNIFIQFIKDYEKPGIIEYAVDLLINLGRDVHETYPRSKRTYHNFSQQEEEFMSISYIMLAAESSHSAMEKLIKYDPSCLYHKVIAERIPLTESAMKNNFESFQLILSHMDVNNLTIEINNTFNSPLHHAAQKSDTRFLEIMIEAGVDVNTPSQGGETALHSAIKNNNLRAFELLIEAGADINQKNISDISPMNLLHNFNREGMLTYLDEHYLNKSISNMKMGI